jgi:hypothetical protein
MTMLSNKLSNTKIAFTSERDGNAEIYAINADGAYPVNQTNNPASDGGPPVTWQKLTPAGRTFEFLKDRSVIYALDDANLNAVGASSVPTRVVQHALFDRVTGDISVKE